MIGENDINIIGNDLNNKVYGNAGDNIFIGKGMDDFFDGGDGNDRANFLGEYDEYAVLEDAQWNDQIMSVVDLVSNRDGIDTLINVEEMDISGVETRNFDPKNDNSGNNGFAPAQNNLGMMYITVSYTHLTMHKKRIV